MLVAHTDLTALVSLAVKLHPAGADGVRRMLDGKPDDSATARRLASGQVINPDAMYSTAQAATLTPWSENTLMIWRSRGQGPSYIKKYGRVVYRGADLLSFIESGERTLGEVERKKLRDGREAGA